MNRIFENSEKSVKFFPAREVKTPDFTSFVSFDIETTGLSSDSEIIEIGAVKVVNGKLTESFSEFVKPDMQIPSLITDITGIDNSMVSDAGKINEVLPTFCSFVGDSILVGHNAVCFDCKIMGHWADVYKINIDNDVFDTLRYARYRCEPFNGLCSRRLSDLCDYFGIEATTYHRAAADAEVTAKLYFSLQKYGVPKVK